MKSLFTEASQITPSVITSVLRSDKVISQSSVAGLKIDPIIGGASFNAQLFRLTLTYDQYDPTYPDSLIAKLPTGNVNLHENSTIFQPGRKETWFYRDGASQTPVNTPHCYYNALDPISGGSILLLEDLAPAQNGNQLDGASVSNAKLALESVARLHAAWWGKEHVKDGFRSDTLEDHSGAAEDFVQRLFQQSWPRFLETAKTQIPDSVRQFGNYLSEHMSEVSSFLDDAPKTLIHGDFRLDNMLFDRTDEDLLCWLIDWEDIDFGNNVYDVAWFIGGCLDIETASEEQDFLQFYYDTLVREGVTGYTWAECQRDYPYAMIEGFIQGVFMATVDKSDSTYRMQLADVIGRRFIHACERLQLHQLIA